MMDEIKILLQYAFRTENRLTIPISAPGSAGMESCFVNLVHSGDKVIVCQNGVFGGRMKENVERVGGTAIMVEDEWGKAIDPAKVEAAFKANPDAKVLAFVHAETSTGAISDAKLLCDIAKKHDALTIVDAVTSLGGSPLEVDAWGIDAVYSGTQKCLSCTPGISPVSFSEAAIKCIEERSGKSQSWFLDMDLVMGYWGKDGQTGGKRAYHHTAPVNSLYALHESLVLLQEEGIENAWQRHATNHAALAAGLQAMGIKFVVHEADRLPQLNTVFVPEGVDEAEVRARLLNQYSLEIGAGLGSLAGKVWRIGLMGYASRRENVLKCISALESILHDMGADITSNAAIKAANEIYATA
jgi:alanine-glyoxylate transaminase/serine-glyoxylate transaminase/serine-pyruvate transaminase